MSSSTSLVYMRQGISGNHMIYITKMETKNGKKTLIKKVTRYLITRPLIFWIRDNEHLRAIMLYQPTCVLM